MKRVLILVALAFCVLAFAGTVAAAEPWMRVRFLQVLVNLDVDGDVTAGDDVTVGDDLTVTDDAAVTGDLAVTGALGVTGASSLSTLALTGSITDSDSAVTVADNAIVDGAADAIQLTVQGYTTQTADVFVVETSAGTDLMTVDITSTVFAKTITQSDGDLTVADDLKISKQTAITVTNGVAFAPTGSYQPIQAAGSVTPTITMGAAGDVVMIVNTSNVTVTIADTSTTMLSAAWAGTQYDTLTLLCDGTNWLEISRSTN